MNLTGTKQKTNTMNKHYLKSEQSEPTKVKVHCGTY